MILCDGTVWVHRPLAPTVDIGTFNKDVLRADFTAASGYPDGTLLAGTNYKSGEYLMVVGGSGQTGSASLPPKLGGVMMSAGDRLVCDGLYWYHQNISPP